MILKGILLIILCVLLAVATLVSLFVGALRPKNRKVKRTALSISFISFIACVFCIYTFVRKTVNVVDREINAAIETIGTVTETENGMTPEQEEKMRERKAEIISYSESSNDSYFTYLGFRDSYRWPLVYPYSINCIDIRDNGFICNESKSKDVSEDGNKTTECFIVHDITAFTFNKDVLIAKTRKSSKSPIGAVYVLFEFENEKVTEFSSYREMVKEANNFGLTHKDTLLTIKEYDLIF